MHSNSCNKYAAILHVKKRREEKRKDATAGW
jgi:hypothetical protein